MVAIFVIIGIGLTALGLGAVGVGVFRPFATAETEVMRFAPTLFGIALMIAGCASLLLGRMAQAASDSSELLAALRRPSSASAVDGERAMTETEREHEVARLIAQRP